MKSKSLLVLLLVAFFAVVASPVFATTQMSPALMATEQLPAWLAEAGAVPLSDVALENAQGESFIGFMLYAGITAGTALYILALKAVNNPVKFQQKIEQQFSNASRILQYLRDRGSFHNYLW